MGVSAQSRTVKEPTITSPKVTTEAESTSISPEVKAEVEFTTMSTEVKTEACVCPCTETQGMFANKTTEELELLLKETTDQLKKELSVDVSKLSASKRKKTSAIDSRPSAAGFGVLGLVLMVSLLTSLVLSDVGRLYSTLKQLYKKRY
ncbi:hypothetical protein KUTeg_012613 [Tegillarca granosa]|uniref:Uncharacterized protein n=1 Tax=Tegillarca granosa TaxID=220873 RepID=A0ABQ9F025_TEGGR|nr:hypothetical protein KUTeg_012613 [Tegillarca granosa]